MLTTESTSATMFCYEHNDTPHTSDVASLGRSWRCAIVGLILRFFRRVQT